MSYTVTEENLANLNSYWTDPKRNLYWPSVFILPGWLQAWWQVFGAGAEIFIRAVRQDDAIIGIAPLMVREKTAYFIGDTDVCDYQDFVIIPGMESDFFRTLFDDLKNNQIKQLDLKHVRPDSAVLTYCQTTARDCGYEVLCTSEAISPELELPPTWEEYLAVLTTKQRHEVRRKLRRLSEAGEVNCRFIDNNEDITENMDAFIRMFTGSRQDKATFLTEQMESFFRLLADTMADAGLLKLGILELNAKPVAAIMCFDYNDCVYLYNSGYEPEYNHLSVGLLSKVFGIQDSIQRGKKRFDFLKGAEPYKYHLGGRDVPLYKCQINMK